MAQEDDSQKLASNGLPGLSDYDNSYQMAKKDKANHSASFQAHQTTDLTSSATLQKEFKQSFTGQMSLETKSVKQRNSKIHHSNSTKLSQKKNS
jgi:hypothetical protein